MENISLLENECESIEDTDRKYILGENLLNLNGAITHDVDSGRSGVQGLSNGINRETCADLELVQNIRELPAGKDRYFFVSYSSEDSERVWSCVEDLENRFKLSCVYGSRDFQPGKNIQENIREGMARSLKVLLFITPNFHQSGWCTMEREYAFMCSVENRTNCIIPVKLDECEIPSALAPLTYVDGSVPGCDIPAKIASALIEIGSFEPEKFLPREYPSTIKRYENGYSFSIFAERETTCIPCRPAKYKFKLSPDISKKMRTDNVEAFLRCFRPVILNGHSVSAISELSETALITIDNKEFRFVKQVQRTNKRIEPEEEARSFIYWQNDQDDLCAKHIDNSYYIDAPLTSGNVKQKNIVPWSTEQPAGIKSVFAKNLRMLNVPNKDECEKAREKEPSISCRDWKNIKYRVHHEIT